MGYSLIAGDKYPNVSVDSSEEEAEAERRSIFSCISTFETAPEGLIKDIKLTFDDFVASNPDITVTRVSGSTSNTHVDVKEINIFDAAKQLKEKKRGFHYFFSLGEHKELNESIGLPIFIEKVDFYSRHWPIGESSKYLKNQSKLFNCYSKDYISRPDKIYGGFCEWIYLLSGRLDLELYSPSEINLKKYSSLEQDEQFIPQQKTVTYATLKPGQLIYIPSSYITVRKSLSEDSFAITGRFFNYITIHNQLNSFEQDVFDHKGKYSLERDCEIRHLYWFSLANWLEHRNRKIFSFFKEETLVCIRQTMLTWKQQHNQKTAISHIYAPYGININLLYTDYGKLQCWKVTKRNSLKDGTNSVNVSSSQTSADDQTD